MMSQNKSGAPNQRIVQQRPDRSWEVVAPHAKRASRVLPTQHEAIDAARQILGNDDGGELRIKGRDGLFRDSDTVAPGHEGPGRDTK
jgi:hypothetical protein